MQYIILALIMLIGGAVVVYLINRQSSTLVREMEGRLWKAEAASQVLESEMAKLIHELSSLRVNSASSDAIAKLLSTQVVSCSEEINKLQLKINSGNDEINREKIKNSSLEASYLASKEINSGLEKIVKEMKGELDILKRIKVEFETKFTNSEANLNIIKNTSDLKLREKEQDLQRLIDENKILSNQITSLNEQGPIRIEQYNSQLEILNRAIENQKEEQARQRELKQAEDVTKARELKETWARHEKDVEEKMKLICQQESIEYIDKEKYPFPGKPDNCIKICDEHIIFDSKSPQGEDLSNLPSYIKNQAEQAKKYLKQDGVKKEIFLVVPTNSISVIKDTHINLGQYIVHVITADAIRPILIQLKRIEEYEFAEQLSPDDRSQIAKTLGRMAHGMKRTVQVSQFMNKEMIAILLDAEKLPHEILTEAQETENKLKLNPPSEKRSKSIKIETLKDESSNLSGKLIGQGIYDGEELQVIGSLPLHTKGPS